VSRVGRIGLGVLVVASVLAAGCTSAVTGSAIRSGGSVSSGSEPAGAADDVSAMAALVRHGYSGVRSETMTVSTTNGTSFGRGSFKGTLSAGEFVSADGSTRVGAAYQTVGEQEKLIRLVGGRLYVGGDWIKSGSASLPTTPGR
jgi:hypothetical protein